MGSRVLAPSTLKHPAHETEDEGHDAGEDDDGNGDVLLGRDDVGAGNCLGNEEGGREGRM